MSDHLTVSPAVRMMELRATCDELRAALIAREAALSAAAEREARYRGALEEIAVRPCLKSMTIDCIAANRLPCAICTARRALSDAGAEREAPKAWDYDDGITPGELAGGET